MAGREEVFAIRSLDIVATQWTDVQGTTVLPIVCNTIVIFNNTGQDILLRTDPTVARSEVTVPSGTQFEIAGWRWHPSARFDLNCAAPCALKASTSPCSPIVESIL